MENFSVNDILMATGGELKSGSRSVDIKNISIDSRKVNDGDLFLALHGERFDGNDFINDAIKAGAIAVVSDKIDKISDPKVALIHVKDCLAALQEIAKYYRTSFDIPVLAVTGSTGKTTTKDMIFELLSRKFRALKTEGNFNNHIGLPLTLFNLSKLHETVVLEMGMSREKEISRLVQIAKPNVGVITNIGLSHIENLGSQENILKAKLELFEQFDDRCVAFLNGDDEMLWNLKDNFPFSCIFYGLREGVQYKAEKVEIVGGKGVSYILNTENNMVKIDLDVPGKHNVSNSLAAIAVARHFGVEFEDIVSALKEFKPYKMRLEISKLNNDITIIDDAYNASPDSMISSLEVLRIYPAKRKIAIIGDMLELGDFSEYAHQLIARECFKNEIDIFIGVGRYSKLAALYLHELGMNSEKIFHFENNLEILNFLDRFIESEDLILIKGSRGMKMEEIVQFLKKKWC